MKRIIVCTFLVVLLSTGLLIILVKPLNNDSLPYNELPSIQQDQLVITVKSDRQEYGLRESPKIYGNLTLDGTPVLGLVAIEIRDSLNPIAYRSLPAGNITETPLVQIVEVLPCDNSFLNPVAGFLLKPYPQSNNMYFKVAVKNSYTEDRSVTTCLYVCDGNGISLGIRTSTMSVAAGQTGLSFFTIEDVPYWSYIGEAKAIANAYTNLPKNGGVPYCLENATTFLIGRGSYKFPESYIHKKLRTSAIEGKFNMTFKLSPEPRSGTYTVFAAGRRTGPTIHATSTATTFAVKSTSYPPQASFTYTPSSPFVNQTVTFDATGSSPEGYNETIVSYEWNFGDLTPPVKKTSPTTTHAFKTSGTYIVTLNVTDSEGLWCTTSKPIVIRPPTGPTADFIWYPATPKTNETVTFNASRSLPGWNGTHETPIVQYRWNFGDGNTTTVTTQSITHKYKALGNYTVTLTVTDTEGLQDNQTYIIRVLTAPPILKGDINGDGVVNILDAILMAKAFGSRSGDPNWDPRADLNNDGVVNILDAIILAGNFGKRV